MFTFSVCTFYRCEEKWSQNIHSSEILLGAYITLETQNHAGAGRPQGRHGAAGSCALRLPAGPRCSGRGCPVGLAAGAPPGSSAASGSSSPAAEPTRRGAWGRPFGLSENLAHRAAQGPCPVPAPSCLRGPRLPARKGPVGSSQRGKRSRGQAGPCRTRGQDAAPRSACPTQHPRWALGSSLPGSGVCGWDHSMTPSGDPGETGPRRLNMPLGPM